MNTNAGPAAPGPVCPPAYPAPSQPQWLQEESIAVTGWWDAQSRTAPGQAPVAGPGWESQRGGDGARSDQ